MIGLKLEGWRGQIKREDAGEAPVHALFRCGEIGAFAVGHVVGGDRGARTLVHLGKHVFKRQTVDDLAVSLDGFPRGLLTQLAAQRVVVLQTVVAVRQLKPRVQTGNVHPRVRDGTDAAVDFACGGIPALDVQFALDFRRAAVVHVEHGELGQGGGPPRAVIAAPAHGLGQRICAAQVPCGHGRDDHQPVAVEQHRLRRAFDGHVGHQVEVAEFGHGNDVQRLPVEVVDVVTVGFHEIGFVHALLLVVGAGEILAGGTGLGRGRVGSPVSGHLGVHGDVVFHPAPAVEVLLLDRLQELDAHLLFEGLLEGILEVRTGGVAGQVRAADRPLRQVTPAVWKFDEIEVVIGHVVDGAKASRQEKHGQDSDGKGTPHGVRLGSFPYQCRGFMLGTPPQAFTGGFTPPARYLLTWGPTKSKSSVASSSTVEAPALGWTRTRAPSAWRRSTLDVMG